MPIAHSKLTAQGQISVPSEIRRRLGVGPGSVLAWDDEAGKVVVRRASTFSSEDIHRAVFTKKPKRRTLAQMKTGIARDMKKRHAGR